MIGASTDRLVRLHRGIACALGAAVILAGCFVLVGWILDVETLRSIRHGGVAMHPTSAFAFILAGVSLWLSLKVPLHRRWTQAAKACALLVTLVGALPLGGYLFHRDFGVNRLLFRENLVAPGARYPLGIAPNAALDFLLMGASLLILDVETRHGRRPAQYLALAAGLVSWTAVTGYVYQVASLYGVASHIPMALNSAVAFTVLSLGVLCARPDRGLMRMVTSSGAGGIIVRRLLPPFIILPLMVGWLRLMGERAGFYDTMLGVAIMAVTMTLLAAGLIWANAAAIDRADRTRHRLEDEARVTGEQLREKERLASIGTLAAGIAHEINNPIGSILLAAQNALSLQDEPDAVGITQRALGRIISNSDRCARIVRSILQFARRETTDKWPNDFNAVVEQAVELTRQYATDHHATIEVQLARGLPEVVLNPIEIEQTFINLIHNAIESGENTIRVQVRTEWSGDSVRGIVEDNGRGMTDEQLRHLFDPFFTTRQAKGGTGLGMSIAHGIVTGHGGTLEVQSRLGAGTTATIRLPHNNAVISEVTHGESIGR